MTAIIIKCSWFKVDILEINIVIIQTLKAVIYLFCNRKLLLTAILSLYCAIYTLLCIS